MLVASERVVFAFPCPASAPSDLQTSHYYTTISQHRRVPRRVSFISLRSAPVCTLLNSRLRFSLHKGMAKVLMEVFAIFELIFAVLSTLYHERNNCTHDRNRLYERNPDKHCSL